MGFRRIFVVHSTIPHPPRTLCIRFRRIFVVNCLTERETATKKPQSLGDRGTRPKTAAAAVGHEQKTVGVDGGA